MNVRSAMGTATPDITVVYLYSAAACYKGKERKGKERKGKEAVGKKKTNRQYGWVGKSG